MALSKDKPPQMALSKDAIYEIFSWLPAKSIFKAKSCSKFIFNFTNNTHYASKQAQNMMLKGDSSLLIHRFQWFGDETSDKDTDIYEIPINVTSSSSSGIPTKFLQFVNERSVIIHASSNGLLLLQIESPKVELFICNPATQSYSIIATPESLFKCPYTQFKFAFIWNHNKGGGGDEEFQLIYFDGISKRNDTTKVEYVCRVYMPKEGVWKEREKGLSLKNGIISWLDGSYVSYKGNILFASVTINTMKSYDRYISSYNIDSGVTRRFDYPNELKSWADRARIFKWGKVGTSDESICAVTFTYGFGFTIWVLNDLESPSWSKVLSLNLKEMGLLEGDNDFVIEYAIMNGDSLVFVSGSRDVYKYDLNGAGTEKRLEKIKEHTSDPYQYMRFLPYSSTLRSCGIGTKRFRYDYVKNRPKITEEAQHEGDLADPANQAEEEDPRLLPRRSDRKRRGTWKTEHTMKQHKRRI